MKTINDGISQGNAMQNRDRLTRQSNLHSCDDTLINTIRFECNCWCIRPSIELWRKLCFGFGWAKIVAILNSTVHVVARRCETDSLMPMASISNVMLMPFPRFDSSVYVSNRSAYKTVRFDDRIKLDKIGYFHIFFLEFFFVLFCFFFSIQHFFWDFNGQSAVWLVLCVRVFFFFAIRYKILKDFLQKRKKKKINCHSSDHTTIALTRMEEKSIHTWVMFQLKILGGKKARELLSSTFFCSERMKNMCIFFFFGKLKHF